MPSARATRRRSRPRSSVRAPTRRTRTSAGPRTSPARPRRAVLRVKAPLMITPGSEQVRATIERDGLLADLEAIGATVLANACGPCIGQWQRDDSAGVRSQRDRHVVQPQLPGPQRRQQEHARVHRLTGDGRRHGAERTARRFVPHRVRPARRRRPAVARLRSRCERILRAGRRPRRVSPSRLRPGSDRLELLEPFPAWDGNDIHGLRVLLKAKGKCTTDHVSPAGKWLTYRGHLTNISQNLFLGAVNAFADGGAGHGRRRPRRFGQAVARPRPRLQGAPASSGSRSATRTTARARRVSTRRWSRATWAGARCWPVRSPASRRRT